MVENTEISDNVLYLQLTELKKIEKTILNEREERLNKVLKLLSEIWNRSDEILSSYNLDSYIHEVKTKVFNIYFQSKGGKIEKCYIESTYRKKYGDHEKWEGNWYFISLPFDIFESFYQDVLELVKETEKIAKERVTKRLQEAILNTTNDIAKIKGTKN